MVLGGRSGRATIRAAHCRAGKGASPPLFEREGARKTLERLAISGLGVVASCLLLFPVPAQALGPVKVPLTDVEIVRTECEEGTTAPKQVGGIPRERNLSNSFEKANGCFTVYATAKNPTSKELRNADVFGRVYDQYGNTARDDTENIRLSYISKIGPGESRVSFKFIINTVFADESKKDGAITIQGLKASGFAGGVMPGQGSGLVTDCDPEFTDPEECETIPY